MIVRDEEPRLPKCLESIAPYVDEMVVVDTGSTDGTREVAHAFGARVYEMPWPDSFATARNQSLELARGDWILRMDADDEILPEHAAQLRELGRRYPDRDVAYTMEYRVPPGAGGTAEHVVDQVQLWPNRPDLRFEHRLHEQLLPSIGRAGLSIMSSGLAIFHRNYDWSPEGQARRRRRDFPLLQLDLRDRPEDPFVLFNLGMTHLYTSRDDEVAAHYLRRSIDRLQPQDSIARLVFLLLATARISQEDWAAALAVNEEGRTWYPDDAGLLLQAGQIYEQMGRMPEAHHCLERLILGYDEGYYRCADEGLRTYRGGDALACLLRRLGRAGHAEQILREIVQTYPFYLPAQLHLAEAVHALGRSDEACRLLAEVPEVEAIQYELHQARAAIGLN